MDQSSNVNAERQARSRSKDRSGGSSYKDVATKAVYKEADIKEAMGPSVSMTVVGEKVEFTQHFHF